MVKNASKEESKVKRISWNTFNLDGWSSPVILEKKKSSKNHKYTYYNLLLHISLLQGSRVQFFLYHLRNSSEAYWIISLNSITKRLQLKNE